MHYTVACFFEIFWLCLELSCDPCVFLKSVWFSCLNKYFVISDASTNFNLLLLVQILFNHLKWYSFVCLLGRWLFKFLSLDEAWFMLFDKLSSFDGLIMFGIHSCSKMSYYISNYICVNSIFFSSSFNEKCNIVRMSIERSCWLA